MKKIIAAALIAALAFVMVGCSCSAQSSSSSSSSSKSSSASSSVSSSSTSSSSKSSSAATSSASAQSSAASSQPAPASSSAAASPTSSSPAGNDTQNPIMNYVGVYGADRATITVGASGDRDADIVVEWPSSASSGSTWHMSGTYDDSTHTVTYTNCTKVDYTYTGEGESNRSETVVYSDGKGSITFGSGNLTWNDEVEHVADGTTFSWAL